MVGGGRGSCVGRGLVRARRDDEVRGVGMYGERRKGELAVCGAVGMDTGRTAVKNWDVGGYVSPWNNSRSVVNGLARGSAEARDNCRAHLKYSA